MTRTYKVLISLALAAVLLAGGLALLKKSSGQRAPSAAPAVVQAPAGAEPPESVRSEMAGEPAPWESAQEDVSSTSARTSTSLPPASLPKAHAALSIAQMDQQIAMQEAQATAILQQLDAFVTERREGREAAQDAHHEKQSEFRAERLAA